MNKLLFIIACLVAELVLIGLNPGNIPAWGGAAVCLSMAIMVVLILREKQE